MIILLFDLIVWYCVVIDKSIKILLIIINIKFFFNNKINTQNQVEKQANISPSHTNNPPQKKKKF